MNLQHFTSVELAGLTIYDPVTISTNVLIFVAGLYSFMRMGKPDALHQLQWRWFLLLIALAGLAGVPVHGLSLYLGDSATLFMWLLMGLLQGLGSTFAMLATMRRWSRNYIAWRYLPVIQFALFTTAFLFFKNYNVVKIHMALSLLPVMFWNFRLYRRGEASGIWIAMGFVLASLTALVHTFKLSFGTWMNFNDISHVLVASGLLLIGEGSRRESPAFAV